MRKHTLEYDDVMNKQRQEIYAFRNEVIHTKNTVPIAEEILEHVCMDMSSEFFTSRNTWDPEGYRRQLSTHFPITFEAKEFENDRLAAEQVEKRASDKVLEAFKLKVEHQKKAIQAMHRTLNPHSKNEVDAEGIIGEVIRNLLIRTIDARWQEHLLHIDHLRVEVNVRSIGQKDPLLEFKHEAFALFDQLSKEIKVEIAHALFKFEMRMPEQQPPTQTIDLPRAKKKTDQIKMEQKPMSPMIDLSKLDLDA